MAGVLAVLAFGALSRYNWKLRKRRYRVRQDEEEEERRREKEEEEEKRVEEEQKNKEEDEEKRREEEKRRAEQRREEEKRREEERRRAEERRRLEANVRRLEEAQNDLTTRTINELSVELNRDKRSETSAWRKAKYKKLCLKWHPDKNPDRTALAAEVFKFLQSKKDWYTS